MFTGIVQLGRVVETPVVDVAPSLMSLRLRVDVEGLADGLAVGESVAVNGVCLTVVSVRGTVASFDLAPETVRVTTLGHCSMGERVNVERALLAGSPMGGHMVSGHVDALATLQSIEDVPGAKIHTYHCTPEHHRVIILRGSVALDGVSLTVMRLNPSAGTFSVSLIPHTLENTTLGLIKAGDKVNLETDMIGKHVAAYLERMRG
ncbi:MAG: riboflavin synthase [Planctomycetota bacterium]